MFNLKDLLVTYKNIPDPGQRRSGLVSEINAVLGGDYLKEADIEVRNHVLYLKSHPAIKHKVFLNKKNTISRINSVFEKEYIVDIR